MVWWILLTPLVLVVLCGGCFEGWQRSSRGRLKQSKRAPNWSQMIDARKRIRLKIAIIKDSFYGQRFVDVDFQS